VCRAGQCRDLEISPVDWEPGSTVSVELSLDADYVKWLRGGGEAPKVRLYSGGRRVTRDRLEDLRDPD
jgi:hypothetical protein